MKKIRITEEQMNRLFEGNGSAAPNFNGGDLKEYPGSEVLATSNVHNSDGELEYGNPTDTDKVQKDICNNAFWTNSYRANRP